MALTRATDKIIANADGNLNLSGIVTAANFVGGGAGLTGLNVDASALKSGSDIKAQANSHGVVVTGVLTATSYSGDGSNLTNLPAGLGTALSSDQTSPLNKLYYTNEILSIASTITVDHPATGTGAYTQYADLRLEEDADLIIADGDDVIPNILGLGTDGGGLGAGGSGRIRVDQITNKNANGAPNFTNGLTATTGTFSGNLGVGGVLTYEDVTNVDSIGIITARSGVHVGPTAGVGATIYIDGGARFSGIVTATSFSGSGANLTNLPAGQLTGTIPDARFPATLPAISGANLTGLPSGWVHGAKTDISGSDGYTFTGIPDGASHIRYNISFFSASAAQQPNLRLEKSTTGGSKSIIGSGYESYSSYTRGSAYGGAGKTTSVELWYGMTNATNKLFGTLDIYRLGSNGTEYLINHVGFVNYNNGTMYATTQANGYIDLGSGSTDFISGARFYLNGDSIDGGYVSQSYLIS